jgi:hypothetical protein
VAASLRSNSLDSPRGVMETPVFMFLRAVATQTDGNIGKLCIVIYMLTSYSDGLHRSIPLLPNMAVIVVAVFWGLVL